jgi:hypothetical protein
MLINFSTNFGWVSKPDPNLVDLGNNWVDCEDTPEKIFEIVSQGGMPICSALTCGNRKQDNFLSSQLALLDVDKGMTIQDLLVDPFYSKYGAGFWTSPSHCEAHHKFRILFILENPITNVEEMRLLLRALMELFPADTACKDATRYFNGTLKATHSDFVGTVLPQSMIDTLLEAQLILEKEDYHPPVVDYSPPSDDDKAAILAGLKVTYLGNYDAWRNVAFAMYNSSFTFEDFCDVTINGLMSKKTRKDCEKLWKDCPQYNKVTYGSLVHLLKERGTLPPSTRDIKETVFKRLTRK